MHTIVHHVQFLLTHSSAPDPSQLLLQELSCVDAARQDDGLELVPAAAGAARAAAGGAVQGGVQDGVGGALAETVPKVGALALE